MKNQEISKLRELLVEAIDDVFRKIESKPQRRVIPLAEAESTPLAQLRARRVLQRAGIAVVEKHTHPSEEGPK